MMVLDIRHFELFLNEAFLSGSCEYKRIRSCRHVHAGRASACVCDVDHASDASSTNLLSLQSWIQDPDNQQIQQKIASHAAAFYQNLPPDDDVYVWYDIMRCGAEREIVAIRVSVWRK